MKTQIKFENSEYVPYRQDDNNQFVPINPLSVSDLLSSEIKQIEQIREYSITPTTFKSREFENNENDLFYKEVYQYNDNQITHFGINILADNIASNLNQIAINTITPSDSASENSSTQESSASRSRKKQTILPKYYELEVGLLDKAITHLLDNQNCKTVVVDIFAQESGELKIDKDSKRIETHPILLYKNPVVTKIEAEETKTDAIKNDEDVSNTLSHEIVVIDPSNSSYSAHLSNITKPNITHANFEKLFTLKTKKPLQIYKQDSNDAADNIGPTSSQYRDCVDIAIKLGFGLNKTDQFYSINVQSKTGLTDISVVKEVTNQTECYDKLPGEVIKYPARLKQSSDIKTQKKVTAYLKALNVGIVDYKIKCTKLDLYHTEQNIADSITKVYSELSHPIPDIFYTSVNKLLSDVAPSLLPIIGDELSAIDQLE